MKILALASLFTLSLPSFAALPALDCSLGQMGEDSYVQVAVSNRRVQINQHESHFEVRRADLKADGNAIAILNKTVKGTVEGDTFSSVVNALLVYNKSKKTLIVSLVMDGHPTNLASSELTCK